MGTVCFEEHFGFETKTWDGNSEKKTLEDELFKPVIRKFEKRKVLSGGIDEIWAADLADRNENDAKFLLMVIDVFSRFGWIRKLKDKKATTVFAAMEDIIKKSGRRPSKLWTDDGAEFKNNLFKKEFDWYTTFNPRTKNPVVERWIRTVKRMLEQSRDKNVERILDVYNSKKHSSLGMSPKEASKKENEISLLERSLGKEMKKVVKRPKLKIGQKVRIPQAKWRFTKGYKPSWTEEIFTISEILPTKPATYRISDSAGNVIVGSFYEKELQPTDFDQVALTRAERLDKKKHKVRTKAQAEKGESLIEKERTKKTARDRRRREKIKELKRSLGL